jgi:hypothetical protein
MSFSLLEQRTSTQPGTCVSLSCLSTSKNRQCRPAMRGGTRAIQRYRQRDECFAVTLPTACTLATTTLIERVILSAGAMLIFDQIPEGGSEKYKAHTSAHVYTFHRAISPILNIQNYTREPPMCLSVLPKRSDEMEHVRFSAQKHPPDIHD